MIEPDQLNQFTAIAAGLAVSAAAGLRGFVPVMALDVGIPE